MLVLFALVVCSEEKKKSRFQSTSAKNERRDVWCPVLSWFDSVCWVYVWRWMDTDT